MTETHKKEMMIKIKDAPLFFPSQIKSEITTMKGLGKNERYTSNSESSLFGFGRELIVSQSTNMNMLHEIMERKGLEVRFVGTRDGTYGYIAIKSTPMDGKDEIARIATSFFTHLARIDEVILDYVPKE